MNAQAEEIYFGTVFRGLEQGTQEWRQLRDGLITGSRVGAMMGVSPFQTRKALLAEMVAEAHGDFKFIDAPPLRWGTENEDKCLSFAEFDLGLKFDRPDFVVNANYPHLGYSPDGIDWDKSILVDGKCPYGIRDHAEPKFKTLKEAPHYWHQLQLGMLVCDLDEAHLYQWTPHAVYSEVCKRDPNYWETIQPEVESFMADLAEAIANHDVNGSDERGDEAWIEAVADYKSAKAQVDHWTKVQNRCRDTLIELAPNGANGAGVKLSKIEAEGRLAYAKIVSDLLPDADLENYRGKPSVSYRITEEK